MAAPHPQLFMRTRGGPEQGWGNINRLVNFADHCSDQGLNQIHFLAEGSSEVSQFISSRNYPVTLLNDDVELDEEEHILQEIIPKNVPSCIVMEMLECSYARQSLLRRYSNSLIVFDDLLDHRYCADLVVCAQTLPGYGNQTLGHPRTNFLYGHEYFIFAPQYKKYVGKERSYTDSLKNVLVAFGGGAYEIAYLKAAMALEKLGLGEKATFILGHGDNNSLKKLLSQKCPDATYLGGINNLDELLWQADLALISGGHLKCEAAITQTPAIMIATQWHQIPLAEEFSKLTKMTNLGYMSFIEVETLVKSITKFETASARQKAAQKAKTVMRDGNGATRVFSAISALIAGGD